MMALGLLPPSRAVSAVRLPPLTAALRSVSGATLVVMVAACSPASSPDALDGSGVPLATVADVEPAAVVVDPADDPVLIAQALLQLAADPVLDASQFVVRAQDGRITLSGNDVPAGHMGRAAALLRLLPSVSEVDAANTGDAITTPPVALRDPQERYAQAVALGGRRASEPAFPAADGSGSPTAEAVNRAASGDRPRTYRVRAGDNLSLIASRTMRDGNQWRRIYELNRAQIGPNPERLIEGMELRIPQD